MDIPSLEQIRKEAEEQIKKVQNSKELEELKVRYLGKKGEITEQLKHLKDLAEEERPKFGAMVNEAKKNIEEQINKVQEFIDEKMLEGKLESEKIDVTLPSNKIVRGSKHPLNRVIEEIEDLFVSMGYDVVSGPELETDEFCFKRLNLPEGHPARDMQDSFYITPEYLLRTQTSAVQARAMIANEKKEPLRIIVPGKTYRREDDATHSHQFNQVEGLVVDENITLAHL